MLRNLKETRRSSKSSRGFTLVEILAALLVLTIMFALVGTLLRTFILQTGRARYTYARRAVKFYWLNSAIGGMFYYILRTPDRILTENREFIEFFDGRPDSMSFITSSPLAFKGVVLDRLYLKDGAIYLNETPIFSVKNDYENPQETEETQQFRILNKVRGIRFTYLKRVRQASATGQPGAVGTEQIGTSFGNANASSAKTVEVDRLDGEVPEGVELSITFDDKKKMDYWFRVQSDFLNKKGMTFDNYHQF